MCPRWSIWSSVTVLWLVIARFAAVRSVMGRSWRTARGGGNSAQYRGYRPPMAGGRVGVVSVAVVAALLAACSGGGGADTTASSRTTTTTPPARTATVVGETVVSNAYRQGVAKT